MTVDDAPFELWMATPSPSAQVQRFVTLDSLAGGISARIIDVIDPLPDVGYKTLVVQGQFEPAYADAGKWYWIHSWCSKRQAVQSGEWDVAAQPGYGRTMFTLPSVAYVSDEMVGWTLQPDINEPVYLPIVQASSGSNTVTVCGDYSALAPGGGVFFRIFAPPGVERKGPFFNGIASGMLAKWVSAASSKCLYAGYRYESPCAGLRDTFTQQTNARQTGWNFAGLHYTLNRHYDPYLMRFTSPDPAASPFYNLFAYAGNSPSDFYDADGLEKMSEEDELYFARASARTKALTDALNVWGLFNGTRDALSENKSLGEVASAFHDDVVNTDWKTVGVSAAYNGANALSGGWIGEVVTAEAVADFTGANVNSKEWRAGGAMGAGVALFLANLNPYSAMAVGLLTASHGVYLAAKSIGGDKSVDPLQANMEMLGGLGMFGGGYARMSRGGSGGGGGAFADDTVSASRNTHARWVRPDPSVKLSTKQQALLSELPFSGSRAMVPKRWLKPSDIVNISRRVGREMAVLTRGNQRMVIMGERGSVSALNKWSAREFRRQGWKFSYHTHPGEGFSSLYDSPGDNAVHRAFGQRRGLIYNFYGESRHFAVDW